MEKKYRVSTGDDVGANICINIDIGDVRACVDAVRTECYNEFKVSHPRSLVTNMHVDHYAEYMTAYVTVLVTISYEPLSK